MAVRDWRIGAAVYLWAIWQMVLGFTDPLIAIFAHRGGFAVGFLLVFVAQRRSPAEALADHVSCLSFGEDSGASSDAPERVADSRSFAAAAGSPSLS